MNYLQFLRRSQAAKIAQMFASGKQGLVYDIDNISTLFQDSAFTVPVTAVEQPVGGMLDLSGRGNHATQATTTKRPIYSRRVNLLVSSEEITNAAWTLFNGGTKTSATRFTFSATAHSQTAQSVTAPIAAGTTVQLKVKIAGTGTCSLVIGRAGAGTYEDAILPVTLVPDGAVITLTKTFLSAHTGVTISISRGTSGTAAYVDILESSLTLATDAHLPYQRVNTDTDYDADPAKFPAYRRADGVDDSLASSTGGGGTAGFFFSAVVMVSSNNGWRILFSDAGANTGYMVRLNPSNQLEFLAGNGSANTFIATADSIAIGATNVVQAWDDGTNLNVKIGNGPTASISRPVVAAGTVGFTMGQNNGVNTGYFNGRSFGEIYRKDSGLTQSQREAVALYQRQKAKLP